MQVRQSNMSLPSPAQQTALLRGTLFMHRALIERDIRRLGATQYNLLLPETHVLPFIIRSDEQIKGLTYGHYCFGREEERGRGVLVATNNRLILLDKKPLFARFDEVAYNTIHGVTYTRTGPFGVVTIRTRAGDITMRTMNQTCAKYLVDYLERQLFRFG